MMLRLLAILFVAFGLSGVAHAQSIPTGCTSTTCPGNTLPTGYLTHVGNQVQSGSGATARLACADFLGSPGDGSMALIRAAGYNCVRIPWRDANLPVPLILSDNFTSLSLHQNWQAGDNWGIGATFDGGLGQGGPALGDFGSQWWVNPFNPGTQFSYPMRSGAYMFGASLAAVNAQSSAFTSKINAPTVVEVFLDDTQSWANMPNSGTPIADYAGVVSGGSTLIVSMPMASTVDDTAGPIAALNAITAGTRDAAIKAIIQAYISAGVPSIILRPGWQMNTTTFPWSVGTTTSGGPTASSASAFVSAWQHIYTLVKAMPGITVKFDWTPMAGWTTGTGMTSLYPGDSYVDTIGIDAFDNVSVTDPNYSVTSSAQMAVAHNKSWSAGEMAPSTSSLSAWAPFMSSVQTALTGVTGLVADHINLWIFDASFGGDPVTNNNTAALTAINGMLSAVSSATLANETTATTCGVNCYANGLYQIKPTGTMQLGLSTIPAAMQTYINNTSRCNNPTACSGTGGFLSYLGAIVNGQNTDTHQFGYWQFDATVPSIPGFDFQFDVESYNQTTNTNDPPEIDLEIYTNADASKNLVLSIGGSGVLYSTTSLDFTTKHTYGINWQQDFVTFYIDGSQVAQIATSSLPAVYFSGNPMFPYFLTGAHYRSNTNPSNGSLPAYVGISNFFSYATKPASGTGCNSSTGIASCVADAAANNLKVVLQHRGNEAMPTTNACYYRAQANGLWYDQGGISNNTDGCGTPGTVTAAQFQANWVSLASQFNSNSTVIGADLHFEPSITATARSGGGGTGNGTFSVSNGNVIDPNGNIYHAYGIDIADSVLSSPNGSLANAQRLFPKLNFVRVVVGDGNCTDASITNCNVAIPTMLPILQQWLNAGIVMMIDPHVGASQPGSNINFFNEASFLGTYAADLRGNHGFLWIEDGNELTDPLGPENANVYNAAHLAGDPWRVSTGYANHNVRSNGGNLYLQVAGSSTASVANVCTSASAGVGPTGTGSNIVDGSCRWTYIAPDQGSGPGFNSIVVFCLPGTIAFGGGPSDSSVYHNMANVIWDNHWYNSNVCLFAENDGRENNCPAFVSQMTDQPTVNSYVTADINANYAYTTTLTGPMPTGFFESGFLDYAGVCGGFTTGTLGSSFTCGTGQAVVSILSPQTTGAVGGSVWDWSFDTCCDTQTNVVNRGSNPATLFQFYGSYVQTTIASNSSGPIIVSGAGGPPNSVTWGGGGSNSSDLVQMCNTVGGAVHTANPNLLIGCPAPLNNTGTTLLSGATKPADCTGIGDLSAVPTIPVTGYPAAQAMYTADFFPQNIAGAGCVDSGATLAADLNAYWGNLIKNQQAFIMIGVGCSCDGTNGSLTDDNAYGAAMQSYLNGTLAGGPTFSSTKQPISNAWATWFYPPVGGLGQNPDGIITTASTTPFSSTFGVQFGPVGGTLNVGQQQWWYSLLFNPTTVPVSVTAWNPTDNSNTTLSNNNLTSTVTSNGTAAVRSTTSKTAGKECEEFSLDTIAATSAVGVANPTFSLSGTLGSGVNGIGVVPNAATTQSVNYNGSTISSHASTPSSSGDRITVCEDLGTSKLWFTDSAMRTALGSGAWNNSGACDPTNSGCGLSFAGLTGPYLLAYNATGIQTSSSTWNPADISANLTLSNGNLTATSAAGLGSVGARANSSKSSGKACFEVAATTISPDWDVGLSNSSYVLDTSGGLGTDANGIGFDPNSGGALQAVFYNNVIVSAGSTMSSNGDTATMCEDFDAHSLWVTSAAMRAAGTPWNNSTTANPATGLGGISTASLTCPCFPTLNNINEVGVFVLNTAGPFSVSTPSGFSPWDTATSLLPVTTLNTAGPFAVATPSGFVPWDVTVTSQSSSVIFYPLGE